MRVIDNLVGGREANLAHHAANPELVVRASATSASSQPGDALFKGADYVFHFAGIGDIVPSIERPTEYMSTSTSRAPCTCWKRRAHAEREEVRLRRVVVLLRPGRRCRRARIIRSRPQYPYALSKYQGEQAVLHWHKVYRLPVNSIRIFNAYGTRVAHHGRLWRGVRRVPRAEARRQAVHGRRRRHAAARLSSTSPMSPSAFLRAAETDITGEIWNVGAGNPQSVNRLVELLGGPVVHIPKRPGEPDCTWADIGKIQARPRLEADGAVRGRRPPHAGRTSTIGATRRCGIPHSIAEATKTWFEYLGREALKHGDSARRNDYRHKIKTAEELRRARSAPARASAR